ncbi:phospholipase A [Gayadomonas joobiniege]|uniref:phospholipase A n=1 Tax=Gayadomonas joobiniege TaxID=1234606 RepID=UPI000372EBD7|nr:phospholipase A [Gayadomonas joobiniege]
MFKLSILVLTIAGFSVPTLANEKQALDCLLKALDAASEHTRVAELKHNCLADRKQYQQTLGALSQRVIREREEEFDPFVITPHKMNYILPAFTTNAINHKAYEKLSEIADNYEKLEAKFQISIKVPLHTGDMLFDNDGLYFAFTTEAWWQIYSKDVSKPFRETNYQPEIFYITPSDWHPFESNTGFVVGLEHQSNGRSTILSRSWNRYYAGLIVEKNNLAIFLRVWQRLNEDPKAHPDDSKGDDNPDISHYMGYFELSSAYTWNDYEISSELRQNFNSHKGALQLNFTFPLWGRLRGYVQAFTGYGESLIDYNHAQTRFGIGIALTDLL